MSVIVCTHNPRPQYLRRVLNSLRTQSAAPETWELVVVDNASASPLSNTWDVSWHPRSRHVREERLGLTFARLRGIAETSGELLVFIDDDNELASDFLEQVTIVGEAYPALAVFGAGKLEPEFETEPPPELCNRVSMLALRTVTTPRWSNNPEDYRCLPWGAGLVVRRPVAAVYCDFVDQLRVSPILDRRGDRLFSGGDDLFSWAAAREGLGFGIFPQLRIKHLIASTRLNRKYFLRLIHDHACSNIVMHCLLGEARPQPMDAFRLGHVLLHGLRNGYFSMRCQLAQARGEAAAADFIADNGIAPLNTEMSETPSIMR